MKLHRLLSALLIVCGLGTPAYAQFSYTDRYSLYPPVEAEQTQVWHWINGVLHGPAIVVASTQVGDGSASAPSYSFANNVNRGFFRTSLGVGYSVGGAQALEFRADEILFGASADVSLSRGAANRLDLASGDSLYLVSGGLGVGAAPPSAGQIQASGAIISSGYYQISSKSFWASAIDGIAKWSDNDSTGGLTDSFNDNPTCATNCGTSPTLEGVDSSFTLTMGASGSPASGFVVTFNGTWAGNPQCVAQMAKAGMAVGKMVLTIVTTTTTATFVTNGTAPATTDMYQVHCRLGQ